MLTLPSEQIPSVKYVGIDAGLKGGISLFDKYGRVIEIFDMPLTRSNLINVVNIGTFFKKIRDNIIVFIEVPQFSDKVQPLENTATAFKYGINLGKIISILSLLKIEFIVISPIKWKKYFGLIRKSKIDSCIKASKILPTYANKFIPSKLLPYNNSHKIVYNDGKAEAFLIGVYGLAVYKGVKAYDVG